MITMANTRFTTRDWASVQNRDASKPNEFPPGKVKVVIDSPPDHMASNPTHIKTFREGGLWGAGKPKTFVDVRVSDKAGAVKRLLREYKEKHITKEEEDLRKWKGSGLRNRPAFPTMNQYIEMNRKRFGEKKKQFEKAMDELAKKVKRWPAEQLRWEDGEDRLRRKWEREHVEEVDKEMKYRVATGTQHYQKKVPMPEESEGDEGAIDTSDRRKMYGLGKGADYVYIKLLEKMVKKVDGGYATAHCHGKDKGKTIHKFKTRRQAMAQHRAIEANKQMSKEEEKRSIRRKVDGPVGPIARAAIHADVVHQAAKRRDFESKDLPSVSHEGPSKRGGKYNWPTEEAQRKIHRLGELSEHFENVLKKAKNQDDIPYPMGKHTPGKGKPGKSGEYKHTMSAYNRIEGDQRKLGNIDPDEDKKKRETIHLGPVKKAEEHFKNVLEKSGHGGAIRERAEEARTAMGDYSYTKIRREHTARRRKIGIVGGGPLGQGKRRPELETSDWIHHARNRDKRKYKVAMRDPEEVGMVR